MRTRNLRVVSIDAFPGRPGVAVDERVVDRGDAPELADIQARLRE
jgi:hypothetical protein